MTRIPESVLRREKDISAAPVAERLSWAANRDTTRPEDIAYCLLGLFGITLPLSYGEGGENAFYRLQEEIIKTTVDMSIFAWGKPHVVNMNGSVPDVLASLTRQREDHQEPHTTPTGDTSRRPYLLASSPKAFSRLMRITVRVVQFCHLRILTLSCSQSRALRREIPGRDSLSFPEASKQMYPPLTLLAQSLW